MAGKEMTMLAGNHPNRVERMVYFDGAYDWSDFGEGWKALPSALFDSADYMGSLETCRADRPRAGIARPNKSCW